VVRDCGSVQEAAALTSQFLPSVVITDLVMPGDSGIDLIRRIRPEFRGGIIVLSGKGTIQQAVEAIQQGADAYLVKPLKFEELRPVLDRMREKNAIVDEIARLRVLAQEGTFGRMKGRSKKMLEVYSMIQQVAPSQIPVLITGESGTGKELVARTIHDLSARRKGPFIAINAAAIPRELIESELFGHERGAFTGAIARKTGCFEMASNGTLLLDEIAEMEEGTQAKLLRVLQEQSFRRIGGSELIHADVRVVAATNRDPKLAMADHKLRKDLYYRLAVMTIHLPPLRERVDETTLRDRTDDITLLARAFADDACTNGGRSVSHFDPETIELLTRYRWPGNVRELRNTIERAIVLQNGPSIRPEDLPAELLADVGYQPGTVRPSAGARAMLGAVEAASSAGAGPGASPPLSRETDGAAEADRPGTSEFTIPLGASAADVEKELIRRTLEMTGGNKTKAARILGLSLKTIHNKAKKYGL
jgi:DNA-binding NtrC family response regulator